MFYHYRTHSKGFHFSHEIHRLLIALITIFGFVSCCGLNGVGSRENDSRTQLFVFLPLAFQSGGSAGFLVPIHPSSAVPLDYRDIFQNGVFFRKINDIGMPELSEISEQNNLSFSFSNPELANLFNSQSAEFYTAHKPTAERHLQKDGAVNEPLPSKTGIIKVLIFHMPPGIKVQSFALVPDINMVMNAQGALSLTTYARNEEHLQEIVAMHPDNIFLPVYTSDRDPVGASVLQPFDEKGRLPAFIIDLRQRAEKAIRDQ